MGKLVWAQQFGRARVAIIHEGGGWWSLERALADVPPDLARAAGVSLNDRAQLWIDFNLVHVSLPGASLLLDTGFGEVDPRDPTRPLVSVQGIQLSDGRDAALAALGISPADITHVLITHLHGDHIAGATRLVGGQRRPAFPNARYYATAREWESAPEFHQRADVIAAQKEALQAAGVIELVAEEREIVPGVQLIPAPGESPGHAIVRIDTGADIVYYLGDLFHQPAEFAHLDWIPRFRDRETLVAVRRHLVPRFAAEDAWLIPAHHAFPAIGKVRAAASGYLWEPLEETAERRRSGGH